MAQLAMRSCLYAGLFFLPFPWHGANSEYHNHVCSRSLSGRSPSLKLVANRIVTGKAFRDLLFGNWGIARENTGYP